MSFQAYLNTIEQKTGKTPAQLRELGRERGWTEGGTLAAGVKPMAIVAVLKEELGLGHGHAMAVVALLKGHRNTGRKATPDAPAVLPPLCAILPKGADRAVRA